MRGRVIALGIRMSLCLLVRYCVRLEARGPLCRSSSSTTTSCRLRNISYYLALAMAVQRQQHGVSFFAWAPTRSGKLWFHAFLKIGCGSVRNQGLRPNPASSLKPGAPTQSGKLLLRQHLAAKSDGVFAYSYWRRYSDLLLTFAITQWT